MNEEVDNLSRLWDKPGREKNSSDPLAYLNRSDRDDIDSMSKLWKSSESEPDVNEGVLKNVLCHNCRCGFETRAHDKDIKCPECGSNESLSIFT